MKPQYKKIPYYPISSEEMLYHCQCCNTRNNRGKPVLEDENFGIFGENC